MDAGLREAGWLSSQDIGGNSHAGARDLGGTRASPLPLSQVGSRGSLLC